MKIAIMGSAPSSRQLAPFNDLEWEIWACSPPNYDLPRIDAWFELHNLDRKFNMAQNGPYVQTLVKHPKVFITQKDPRIPHANIYPWGRILNTYGPYFLTSSIALMMAYAIEKKPKKIGLWGVDMAATSEYAYQRPGCWYFMEKAREAGIDVYLPPQSDLAACVPVYGLREFWPQWGKYQARKKELQERLKVAESANENSERDILMIRGTLDDMNYNDNTWVQPTPDYRNFMPSQTEEEYQEFVTSLIKESPDEAVSKE